MSKVALLIGVSEYEPGLNPLPASVKDIEAMKRVLQDSQMGDFQEVKALANPTRQKMEEEVESLFSARSKDDLVVLFFSGHGIKDDAGRLYFATRNTRKNSKGDLVRATAVSTAFVHQIMNNSRAKRQAVILDCCFSGAFDPALQAKDDGQVDLRTQLGAEGRVVLTSSSSTQYSFEQQGSDLSIYTRYLIEGIETGAGDQNEDGHVSLEELHDYATTKVRETAPQMTPKLITLKDKGFRIVISKALVSDPQLRYRRQVAKSAERGTISTTGRAILTTLQQQLGISPEDAQTIEAEVLRPYRARLENIERYRHTFAKELNREYPLSDLTKAELKDFQQVLGLRDQDVQAVETEEVSRKEATSSSVRTFSASTEPNLVVATENQQPPKTRVEPSAQIKNSFKASTSVSSQTPKETTSETQKRNLKKWLLGSLSLVLLSVVGYTAYVISPRAQIPSEGIATSGLNGIVPFLNVESLIGSTPPEVIEEIRTSSPETFIQEYFSLINRGKYQSAWGHLTSSYQEESGSYESYEQWWGSRVAEIFVPVSTQIIESDDESAVVYTQFSVSLDDGSSRQLDKYYSLQKSSEGIWKIASGSDYAPVSCLDVGECADDIVLALKNRDMERLSQYVHPAWKLRFSPSVQNVSVDHQVFPAEAVADLLENPTVYNWGSGNPINLTFAEYYEEWLYEVDYVNADEIRVDSISQEEGASNIAGFYADSSSAEYFVVIPDVSVRALILVFRQEEGRWYLIGLVNGRWQG